MNRRELKQAGALLYACEGSVLRKDHRGVNRYIYAIDFTNCRPQIIALFTKFLREILNVDPKRLRGQLFIYPDHNKNQLIKYWSKITKIPITQFQKVILLKQKNVKYKPNIRGTFKIRYSSKETFLKLQDIIEAVWRDAGVV